MGGFKYNFIKVGKYEIWHNFLKRGFHIRLGLTRLSGFISTREAKQFIKEYL